MENNIGIYLYTNVHTCKVYVGQSNNLHSRHNDFKRFNSRYAGRKMDRARKKYPHPEDWDYKILVYCSEEELDFYESYYIGVYDAVRSGYNCESGGNKNKHISEENRKKQSESMKGRYAGEKNPNYGKVMPQEQREKISITKKKSYKKENHPNYGKVMPQEQRNKISESVKKNSHIKGKHLTDEHKKHLSESVDREKMSIISKERWKDDKYKTKLNEIHNSPEYRANQQAKQAHPIVQLTLDGEFVREWSSASRAGVEGGFTPKHILRCVKGEITSYKKFKWVKASEYYNKKESA